MKRMRRCSMCGAYTLDELHCAAATKSPHPPKYLPEDRYAKYRRQSLKEEK